MTYIPRDHMWIVAGDETQWWSSKASAYVAPDQAWLNAIPGRQPTRILNEDELSEVLANYGLTGPISVPHEVSALKVVERLDADGLLEAAETAIQERPIDHTKTLGKSCDA